MEIIINWWLIGLTIDRTDDWSDWRLIGLTINRTDDWSDWWLIGLTIDRTDDWSDWRLIGLMIDRTERIVHDLELCEMACWWMIGRFVFTIVGIKDDCFSVNRCSIFSYLLININLSIHTFLLAKSEQFDDHHRAELWLIMWCCENICTLNWGSISALNCVC